MTHSPIAGSRVRSFSLLASLMMLIGWGLPQVVMAGTGYKWIPMGPAPSVGTFNWKGGQTGRATAIAVNPFNESEVWLGTAGGGVWLSTDGGHNWSPMSDDQPSLAVGSLALADCHPSPDFCHAIYAGTGENGTRRDTYYGAGLLVGAFDGLKATWTLRRGQFLVPPAPSYDFTHGSIFNVLLDTRTSGAGQVIYITLSSGVTASATESTVTAPVPLGGYGIFKSTNNGATWTKLFGGRPTDLEFDPNSQDILFAGLLGRGIYRSINGGATWCPLNPGVPQPAGCTYSSSGLPDPTMTTFDHVEIASAVPNATGTTHLYATFGQCSNQLVDDCQPMVYESTDGVGLKWAQRWAGNKDAMKGPGAAFCPGGYTRYTHALTVSPLDQTGGTVFLGGVHLCRSNDHGQTWTESDTNADGCMAVRPEFNQNDKLCSIHFDHHAVVFVGTDRVYDANDGGFAFSIDHGIDWTPGIGGLSTMEFQSIAAAPFTDSVIGGLQDNGGAEWLGSKVWNEFDCCGDGGFAVMQSFGTGSSLSIHTYITSNYGKDFQANGLPDETVIPIRSQSGGNDWDFFPVDQSPKYDLGIEGYTPDTKHLRSFYPPFVNPYYNLFGTQALFLNGNIDDDAVQWSPISPTSPPLSSDPEPEIMGGLDVITAIDEAATNHAHFYLGYYSGKTFWTTGACTTPTMDCSSPSCWKCGTQLPGPVTWIAADPANENTAYATVSGFSTAPHVWRTMDGGQTWSPMITSPDLVGVPANTIAIEPDGSGTLYLGTDKGVYKSAGGAFNRFSDGLPNVPVYAFALDPTRSRVIAATHGRGAWMLTPVSTRSYVAGPIQKLVLDQPVFGHGFQPNQGCSMRLIQQDGTVCASGSIDAIGGSLVTDGEGFLGSSKPGSFANLPLAWACANGKCLGRDAHACSVAANPLSSIEVQCGNQVSISAVPSPADVLDPAPGILSLTDHTGGSVTPTAPGTFNLLPSVQTTDGSTRILCAVNVPFSATDSTLSILQSAANAVNQDPGCQAVGVTAYVPSEGASVGSIAEDKFPIALRLTLHAPSVTGSSLVASMRALPGQATGLCFQAGGLGSPARDQLQNLRVHLMVPPGGAAGGSLTVTERSGLGDCTISIPTSSGASGAGIAAALAAAFQSPGTPGTCPSLANPRDLTAHADSVETAFASQVVVCSDDAALGVALAPPEVCFSSADCDDGNPCTNDSCDPTTGQCHSTPAPDGQACDDGNACTTGNTCQQGACGVPVVCGGGSACSPSVCDPASGACVTQPKVCDDGNPCTQDSCNAAGQCVFTPLAAGSSCDDGDFCTAGDTCTLIPGSLIPICQGHAKCDDGNSCTGDHCDPATGACVNVPIQCDDGNPCTIDTCQSGGCVSTPVPNGTSCTDGNQCTAGGTCQTDPFTGAATCVETPVNCDDGDACTMDSCDPTTGGCNHTPIASSEVPTGFQFTSASSMNWPGVSGASFYNTYRGTIPLHMMGSRPPAGPLYDQVCFEYGDAHGDGATISTDTATPPVGTGFYYLVSEETGCAESSIGSDSNTTPIPNASPCSDPAPPALQIVKSHSGNFTQGQMGATYTVIISNIGPGPSFGMVTVTDLPPAGLTLVSMAGPGWSCPASPGDTCTRSDTLGPGLAYPPITVTVNVASNATSPQVNKADVSGGGAPTASSSDSTTIIQLAPALSIVKSHTGHFYRGETGATYTVSVSNTGNAPTSGTVTVTDNAPVGLTNVSMSGTGWTCPTPGSTCTRSDALAAGSSYPDLTVSVDVAPDAPIPSLTNQVTASGGGAPAVTANDPTTIDYPIVAIIKSHVGNFVQGQQGAVFNFHVQNQGFGPTTGTITVTEVTPAGLTVVSMSGTGWTCPASPGNTCTRSDSLASAASYPDITTTVNVALNAPSSVTNEADAVGGGSVGTAKGFDFVSIDTGRIVLGITKSHNGDFIQGQQNATYTLTVSNGGNLATSGTVTVTENAPTGLTLVSMAGTGWTCPASPGNTCTRSDALAPSASYPGITVTVNVAVNASSPLTNQATATGGGDGTLHTANDPTNVNPGPPVLAATKSHNGNFSQGQTGATYTVIVSNVGSQPTVGPVNVDELPPPGLAPVSMAGTGWTCSPAHCNRNDSLPPGSSYPPIIVTVNVLAGATSPQVNQVNVGGGGSGPVMASDSTTIIAAGVPNLTITKSHVGNFTQGQTGATYTLTVTNNIGAGTTVGAVNVNELPPSGLAPVSMAGTGWACSATHCSRTTVLAAGASYPPITVTVNVLATATSPQINQAQVTGGGSAPLTTSDSTVILPP